MSSKTQEELIQQLVEAFRALLDEALVVAISSDHDLKIRSEYEKAKETLQGLAQDVTSEEATGFNPSGFSGVPEEADEDASTEDMGSSQIMSRAPDTDTTVSDQTSSTGAKSYSMPRLTSFNNDSEESKVALLQSMFGELKEYDIRHSLKGANGDFQTALDELLNVQYLKMTNQEQKGIDAFFQPDNEMVGKKKKRKNKKKGKNTLGADTPSSSEGTISPNDLKEMKRQDEIAYLADRLDLPFEVVSEIYHQKRCISGATAVEILDQYISQGIEAQDDAGKKHAQELVQKYRNVPDKYMSTIVQVTGSVSQESDDIASLLSKHFAKNPWSQKLEVNYALSPLPKEDIEGFETVSSGRSTPSRALKPPASNPAAYVQAAEKANQYSRAKQAAAASAAQMNRRGGSNPLYRQAAGYYAEVAREQGRHAQQATSTAADLLVEQQSSANSIDLHGVYVQDGVRIARQRVQAWWAGLGEFRSERARQHPYTVITGLGRHSAGGVSQLRQAVARALLQDGWKMQVETGRFLIQGRR